MCVSLCNSLEFASWPAKPRLFYQLALFRKSLLTPGLELGYGYLRSSIWGAWPGASGVFQALLGGRSERGWGERGEASVASLGGQLRGQGWRLLSKTKQNKNNPLVVVTGASQGHTCFPGMGSDLELPYHS